MQNIKELINNQLLTGIESIDNELRLLGNGNIIDGCWIAVNFIYSF